MPLQKGDSVTVHYEGKLHNGSIFDSSYQREPLSFVIGGGILLKKFEEAMIGRESGDTIELVIPQEDAYGVRDDSLILQLERSVLDVHDIQAGSMIEIETDDGPIAVYVIDIDEHTITIDGNHPLAGHDLYFTITIQ